MKDKLGIGLKRNFVTGAIAENAAQCEKLWSAKGAKYDSQGQARERVAPGLESGREPRPEGPKYEILQKRSINSRPGQARDGSGDIL